MLNADSEHVIRRTRIDNAGWVIRQLEDLGFDPNASSRLKQMKRALNRGYTSPDDPLFLTVLEAERDVQQLAFILDVLACHRDDPEFRSLVKHAICDSVLPQHDRKESPGRDAQCHLIVAAYCQNAGLTPVNFEEPDITCVVQSTKFAIAVKRVKKMKRFLEHLDKAANQIKKSNVPGIIAVDVSLALNQHNVPIASPIHSRLFPLVLEAQTQWLGDNYHAGMCNAVRGKGVRGIIVLNWAVRLRPTGEWGLDGCTHRFPTAFGNEKANFEGFVDSFLNGVPNVQNLADDA